MNIRFADKNDKEVVLKLLDELGEEINRKEGFSPSNTEAQEVGSPIFEEIVSRKDTMIFLGEENGKIFGLVSFYLLPNMRHGVHRGHIEDMVVSGASRGMGVGSGLLAAVKDWCKKNNIKVIKLDSGLSLTEAHQFYEKNGGKFTEKMFRFDIS